jgi:hypothetical protein
MTSAHGITIDGSKARAPYDRGAPNRVPPPYSPMDFARWFEAGWAMAHVRRNNVP